MSKWGAGLKADILFLAVALVIGLASCQPREVEVEVDGSFTDPRDGKIYGYVNIGSQTWMAENLNYAVDSGTGSWCYKAEEKNCNTYGRLYTWESAHKVCPAGWHLPEDHEWKNLEIFLGMDATEADSTGWRTSGNVGILLKSTWDWNSGGTGENTSRFTALPAGFREPDGQYFYIGDITTFWSATYTDETHSWGRAMIYHSTGVYRWKYSRTEAFSVRCIKNS